MDEEVRLGIASIETIDLFKGTGQNRKLIGRTQKVRLPDRIRALELLGKHLRLFTDVVRHEDDINIRECLARGRRRAMGKRARESEPEA